MNFEIKPLTPELAADFFDFFDNRAFSDNSQEGPCYCTRFQMTKEEEKAAINDQIEAYGGWKKGLVRIIRQLAEQQIGSFMGEVLTGDARKNALDFFEYLMESELQLRDGTIMIDGIIEKRFMVNFRITYLTIWRRFYERICYLLIF